MSSSLALPFDCLQLAGHSVFHRILCLVNCLPLFGLPAPFITFSPSMLSIVPRSSLSFWSPSKLLSLGRTPVLPGSGLAVCIFADGGLFVPCFTLIFAFFIECFFAFEFSSKETELLCCFDSIFSLVLKVKYFVILLLSKGAI